jgi:hypothetical protein
MGGFPLHSRSSRRGNGHHQMGGSLLNRSVSRGPRLGHSQRSYFKLNGGVGWDWYFRVNRTQATRRSIGADLATRVK